MTGPATYVHLPTVKYAFQYDGTNGLEIALWAGGKAYVTDIGHLVVKTKQGDFTANVGDYVIHDPEGGFYPCPEPIFIVEYEPAGEGS